MLTLHSRSRSCARFCLESKYCKSNSWDGGGICMKEKCQPSLICINFIWYVSTMLFPDQNAVSLYLSACQLLKFPSDLKHSCLVNCPLTTLLLYESSALAFDIPNWLVSFLNWHTLLFQEVSQEVLAFKKFKILE